MASRKLAVTGVAAACAACCAPLVVPLVWPALAAAGLLGAGGAGGGWLAGLDLDVILCGGLALAVLAGGTIWLRQRRKPARAHEPVLPEGAACDMETCGPGPKAGGVPHRQGNHRRG